MADAMVIDVSGAYHDNARDIAEVAVELGDEFVRLDFFSNEGATYYFEAVRNGPVLITCELPSGDFVDMAAITPLSISFDGVPYGNPEHFKVMHIGGQAGIGFTRDVPDDLVARIISSQSDDEA